MPGVTKDGTKEATVEGPLPKKATVEGPPPKKAKVIALSIVGAAAPKASLEYQTVSTPALPACNAHGCVLCTETEYCEQCGEVDSMGYKVDEGCAILYHPSCRRPQPSPENHAVSDNNSDEKLKRKRSQTAEAEKKALVDRLENRSRLPC